MHVCIVNEEHEKSLLRNHHLPH